MRRAPLVLPLFTLLVLLTARSSAQDKKDEEKKGLSKQSESLFAFPKTVQLTDEQKAKVESLKKEFSAKLAETEASMNAVMTPERKKAAEEARKKAASDGKKGKELGEAVDTALGLSADEKAKLKEATMARTKLAQEITKQKMALLTDEQKAQLKPKPKDK